MANSRHRHKGTGPRRRAKSAAPPTSTGFHDVRSASGPRVVQRRNGCRCAIAVIRVNVAKKRSKTSSPGNVRPMNFASDNTAPVAPAILEAIAEANRGYARGYGNDDWTAALERRFCEIFERDVAAFLV